MRSFATWISYMGLLHTGLLLNKGKLPNSVEDGHLNFKNKRSCLLKLLSEDLLRNLSQMLFLCNKFNLKFLNFFGKFRSAIGLGFRLGFSERPHSVKVHTITAKKREAMLTFWHSLKESDRYARAELSLSNFEASGDAFISRFLRRMLQVIDSCCLSSNPSSRWMDTTLCTGDLRNPKLVVQRNKKK